MFSPTARASALGRPPRLGLAWLVVLAGAGAGCAGSAADGARAAADEAEIRVAVLRHMVLERGSGDGQAAPSENVYFIKGPPPVVAALLEEFRGRSPPVKSTQDRAAHGDGLVDAATGKRGTLLSVPVVRRSGDEAAAFGEQYAGPLASTFYAYSLRREHGRWIVVSRNLAGVS